MKESPRVEEKKDPQAVGPFVAAIIIVLLFAIGGVYFFVSQEQRIEQERQAQQEAPNS